MKSTVLTLPLIITLAISFSACRQQPDRDPAIREMTEQLRHRFGRDDPGSYLRVYPFKSGVFVFRATGGGTPDRHITIHVDEYGHFESQQSIISNSGEIYNWTIIRGMDLWYLDKDARTATLAALDQRYHSGLDLNALAATHGSEDQAVHYLEQQGIQLLPDEAVDDYTCQVILRDMGHYTLIRWVYQGIDFQMAVVLPPNDDVVITREFVSAEFGVPTDDALFDIPGTYSIVSTVMFE